MANTKQMTREQRKQTKRLQRHEFKALLNGLTHKERSAYRASNKGLKAFLREKEKAE